MKLFKFVNEDTATGLVLLFAAVLALILHNSPLGWVYELLLDTPVSIHIGSYGLEKHLLHWINDGLMVIFFLLVGLEIKREILEGELASVKRAALPALAALGGVMAPAIIYYILNHGDVMAMRGWAIPVATDIAFAVGVIALLGRRVPYSLKVLLLSIAIIDDLAAIVIIAVFYTEELSLFALLVGVTAFLVALLLNRLGVKRIAPYILIGVVMWLSVLESGVHATLAGVFLAIAIPLKGKQNGHNNTNKNSPLLKLEHSLKPWVAFMIMPVFAFANAGLDLHGLSLQNLADPVPAGIILGLFFGKQIGIFLTIFGLVKLGICQKPDGTTWPQIYGLAILCGIGFTMSLFIGSLAYTDPHLLSEVRLGVLVGSTLSAVAGYIFLLKLGNKTSQD